MKPQVYFDNYSAIGDLTVIAICMSMLVLLAVSYVKKNKSSALFLNIIIYLIIAAVSNVLCHTLYTLVDDGNYTFVYFLRVLYHAFLFSVLLLYVVYIVSFLDLDKTPKYSIMAVSFSVYFTMILFDIYTTVNGTGFRLDENGKQVKSINVFLLGFVLFSSIIIIIMVLLGKKMFRRVMNGFYGTIIISFIILATQGRHGQTSFTTVSFIFPTIAMLYLLHSSPYDAELGFTNLQAFEDTVSFFYKRKQTFIYVSLYLPDFDKEGLEMPSEIKEITRELSSSLFKGVTIYQMSPGRMIFVAKKSANPNYKKKSIRGVSSATSVLVKNKYDYKIIMGSSDDEISSRNCYLSFLKNVYRHMNINEVHISSAEDVKKFHEYEYILGELSDIYKKKDPDDPRVLTYCQPVYNIKTNKYDTAETLVRLELEECGILGPDRFICLAEEYGYINALTYIIVSKACREIRMLEDEGFDFKRISVNLSMLDMKNASFTEEVIKIIDESGITPNKIAFEITESQSEYDINVVKHKIDELKEKGIKFYLDDFGTGFSNMERLLELPFDIIKFDRSLVIASNSDDRSKKMVGSLANMFSNLNYRVLYEGIEDENDEERCRKMSASYLQGFKYSKPIPLAMLRNFFEKTETVNNSQIG